MGLGLRPPTAAPALTMRPMLHLLKHAHNAVRALNAMLVLRICDAGVEIADWVLTPCVICGVRPMRAKFDRNSVMHHIKQFILPNRFNKFIYHKQTVDSVKWRIARMANRYSACMLSLIHI